MIKFTMHNECPKCGNIPCPNNGHIWRTIKYVASYLDWEIRKYDIWATGKAGKDENYIVPEHLKMTCVRCGFTWNEKPLDSTT